MCVCVCVCVCVRVEEGEESSICAHACISPNTQKARISLLEESHEAALEAAKATHIKEMQRKSEKVSKECRQVFVCWFLRHSLISLSLSKGTEYQEYFFLCLQHLNRFHNFSACLPACPPLSRYLSIYLSIYLLYLQAGILHRYMMQTLHICTCI